MRLNIEDEAFSDPRFLLLSLKMGNNFPLAMGTLAFLWRNSQKEHLISVSEKKLLQLLVTTNKQLLDDLVECGYLIKENNDYLIVGNQKQIESATDWYSQKVAAGLASAEARKQKKLQAEVNDRSTEVNDRSTEVNDRSTEVNDPPTKVNESQRKSTQEQEQEQEQEQKQKGENTYTSVCEQPDLKVKSKKPKKVAIPQDTPFPIEKTLEIWNTHKSQKQSPAQALNPTRIKEIIEKMKLFPKEEQWVFAVQNLAKWKWGNAIGGDWKASFDYLIDGKNVKPFEGELDGEKVDPNRKLFNNCIQHKEEPQFKKRVF